MGFPIHRISGRDDLPNMYVCELCDKIMVHPMFCPRSHRFCGMCIREFVNINHRCPIDDQNLDLRQLNPCQLLRNVINDFEVTCKFKCHGCKEISQLSKVEDHELLCRFRNFDTEVNNANLRKQLQVLNKSSESTIAGLRIQLQLTENKFKAKSRELDDFVTKSEDRISELEARIKTLQKNKKRNASEGSENLIAFENDENSNQLNLIDRSCPFCPFSCQHIDDLDQHLREHCTPFGCDQCEKKFSANSSLKKHFKRHHKSQVAKL